VSSEGDDAVYEPNLGKKILEKFNRKMVTKQCHVGSSVKQPWTEKRIEKGRAH